MSTPIVATPARLAASQSHVESPTITRRSAARLVDRRVTRSGSGLVRSHVGRARPAVGELARVEQVEVVVDLVLLGRGGEHERVAAVLQLADQLARARERPHLADQLHVEVALVRADGVSARALEVVARERADQLVPAHPDVAVDAIERQRHVDRRNARNHATAWW